MSALSESVCLAKVVPRATSRPVLTLTPDACRTGEAVGAQVLQAASPLAIGALNSCPLALKKAVPAGERSGSELYSPTASSMKYPQL